MSLILPLCRLLLVAQNVWATYHVLKTPRASSTTGQPSQRALASRKRAMKSCLAVWLVWACIWLAEGPLDSTIGIVMPFYNEAKTLVLLGLLIFKSYAAEPIVLHVIRPAIKPYASTLDGLLDLFALLGGLAVSAVLMPWHALLAWWDAAPRLGDPAVTSSSSSGSASSDDDYARRVAIGDRAALQDAQRRANAVFAQIDDAQRRHREYSQSRERPAQAPVPRHSRNSSSSSSVPPAPGAWTYTSAPARPSSRTGHYAPVPVPVRQPSATYTQAAQYPPLPRQPSASYTQPAAPRPPSRTSQYASRPQPQPQAGPSHDRRASGGNNPYEIWYPPPQRAPSPGSQATQTFYYPTQRQQQEPIPTPPPPYESVRARRTSAPPETPLRLPGALPFSPPSFPVPLPFPVPAPAHSPRGFELPPAGEKDTGGDGRPRDFIDLTADPPPSSREKALPSPPLDPEPDVMEIDALPARTRTRRKRVHEPEPAGAAPEELSGGESDTTSSSVVKKRRVAGGRVARRVAAFEDVPEQPATIRRTEPAPPPVAPKPSRLKGAAVSRKDKDAEKVPAARSKAPALAHQSAPPPAAALSASTSTRTTRSSSRTADAAQGLAALDAAAAAAPKRRSRR